MRGVVLALLLAGCASAPPAVHTECLPMRTYTADEQRALAAAVAQLPVGSPLVGAMADYGALRAANRACRAH